MTVIDVSAAVTALGGRSAVQDGYLLVEYLRGADGHPSARIYGDTVLLPQTIRVSIINGEPTEPVNVPPTDGECYARITIESVKPYAPTPLILSAVAVPPSGPVDISDLVAVDPSTYEPTTTVVTAWQAAIDEAERIRTVIDVRAVEVADDRARAEDAAADAGGFAEATEFDAGRAGDSAFEAGKSAAIALGHRNAAKTSEDAAAGSAGAAAASVAAANGERIGAGDERAGARQERQDAQAARAGAETARGGAETAQAGAVTARGGAETARAGAEQARDVSLAGQFAGTSLGTTDLNTVTTPGVYRQSVGNNATLSANYPAAGLHGVLDVRRSDSGAIVQRYSGTFGHNTAGKGEWIRRYAGSAWDAWRFEATQRIVSPAGQPGVELYTWDDVNAREQILLPGGVDVGGLDLNAITVVGDYRVGGTATNAPTTRPGNLRVSYGVGSNRLQVFTSESSGRNFTWRRWFWGGAWQAWQFVPTQRVDQTAGRAIYTWDDVNGREQLIYGDTGIRNVLGDVINGWSTTEGVLEIRRTGAIVTVEIDYLNQAAATADAFYGLPVGFRPRRSLRQLVARGATLDFVTVSPASISASRANRIPNGGGMTFSWQTVDPWPTALPGTSASSAPST